MNRAGGIDMLPDPPSDTRAKDEAHARQRSSSHDVQGTRRAEVAGLVSIEDAVTLRAAPHLLLGKQGQCADDQYRRADEHGPERHDGDSTNVEVAISHQS